MRKFFIKFISFLLAVFFYIPVLLLLIILAHTGPVPSLTDLMFFFHRLLVGKTYKDLKKSYREFKRELLGKTYKGLKQSYGGFKDELVLSKTSAPALINPHFLKGIESEQNDLVALEPLDAAFLLSKRGL